ncbi:MarR family winged helix-turn-helix transcriptional regulator [Streptomyces sp. NBC_01198]|uniref:MarR family winged helix-turn-helix transcriptional regulator n=1 Tax=Streptomyces sp. NBC_01198 TaxID=2903769 RepID=UPI002E0D7176|nr:MarR family transcriptional regulator [Streptomyces sp. NBC_01198]
MTDDRERPGYRGAPQRVGFLLAQVGGYAAARFAERLADLSLQPSDIGILRLIALESGLSQRALADHLGVGPSRVVVLIDELESRGLVARVRSTRDRRNHELQLTDAGDAVMRRMREIGSAHEDEIVDVLTPEERETLAALLAKVAASHDLTPNVHPGYRFAGDNRAADRPTS